MNQIFTIIVAGLLSFAAFSADRLNVGEKMPLGQELTSANGKYVLKFSNNGDLALYEKVNDQSLRRMWTSNVFSDEIKRLMMEKNGNLTVRDHNNKIIWQSHTRGGKNSYVVVQDDGNLVIYTIAEPTAVWATGTNPEPEMISE